MKRKKGTAHSKRYPLSIQDIINDVLDLIPAHSQHSSTRYSPTHGGLIRSHHAVERAPIDYQAVCRGYINPDAPAKVSSDKRKARHSRYAPPKIGEE
jgi:hypothetical protein